MVKKLLAVVLVVSGVVFSAHSQVKLLSLKQMEERIARGKDTVYVVNFWATWCAPCIEELPYFEKLQQTYRRQPLKVLLISLDFKSKLQTAVNPFVKRQGLKNEVFLLNEKNEQDYINRVHKNWSGALPATLVINQKRKIRRLYEQEFTWKPLENVYLTSK